MWQTIIYLCALLLVPLLPAYLLFKFLPSKAVAKGPFKGLRIDLSGAFAGYFVLVLLAYSFMYNVKPNPPEPGEMWMVTGCLTHASDNDKSPINEAIIQTFPPANIDEQGVFTIYILRKVDPNLGEKRFPDLQFSLDGHQHVTVHLDDEVNQRRSRYGALNYDVYVDNEHHQINITKKIAVGTEARPYAPVANR
jgi:hypothetical protein